MGFLLILVPVATYGDETRFPGLNALAPCLGTAILIHCGPTRYLGRILVNPLAVGLGLISYSLYLVHWPFYVFYVLNKADPLSVAEQALLISIAIAAAFLMYRFVEIPSRRPLSGSILANNRTFAKLAGALAMSLAAVSAANAYTGGWGLQSLREDKALVRKLKAWEVERFANLRSACGVLPERPCAPVREHQKSILIMGDSHAPDALNAFQAAAPGAHYEVSSTGGCPPLVTEDLHYVEKFPNRAACHELTRKRLDPAYLNRFDVIAINVNYGWYNADILRRYVERIRKVATARLVIFGGFIDLKRPCNLIAPSAGLSKCFEARNIKAYRLHEDELKALASDVGATFISKSEVFCGSGPLEACRFIISGTPATVDTNHMTMLFAKEMGRWIKERHGDLVAEADGGAR